MTPHVAALTPRDSSISAYPFLGFDGKGGPPRDRALAGVCKGLAGHGPRIFSCPLCAREHPMLLQSLFGIGPFCVLHLMWLRGSAIWRVLLRLSRCIPPVHAQASLRGRGSPPFSARWALSSLLGVPVDAVCHLPAILLHSTLTCLRHWCICLLSMGHRLKGGWGISPPLSFLMPVWLWQ